MDTKFFKIYRLLPHVVKLNYVFYKDVNFTPSNVKHKLRYLVGGEGRGEVERRLVTNSKRQQGQDTLNVRYTWLL